MDRLRQILSVIQKHLGGLGPTHKLLIGSLAVILLMTLFLVSQYAGRPALVELLPTASVDAQQRALAYLAPQNLGVRDVNGRAMVPSENRQTALGLLTQSGQAPPDTTLVFENILEKQSFFNSRETNRAIYKRMLENELSGIISRYKGVSLAKVVLDVPEPAGIGQSAAKPKAAITLFSDHGGPVEQKAVDAAARFVAGAVARLDLDRVIVSDGTTGTPRTVTDDSRMVATTYRDAAQMVERQFRERLYNLLGYIDGVVVEVTATVDVTRVKSQVNRNLDPKQGTVSLLKKETSSTMTEGTTGRAGEPGVRSNQGADINSVGSAPGTRSDQTESTTEFENHVGTKVEQIEDPRGHPLSLAATVSVPRSFIVEILRREKSGGGAAPDAAAPTDAEVRTRFDQEKAGIEESVRPHLQTRTPDGAAVPGQVVVVMTSGEGGLAASGGSRPGMTGAGVGGTVGTILAFGGGIVDKAILGVLALIAVGMMLLMVRKAGRPAVMPSAEELVGVPPALSTKSDLVGEADETDTPIEGIEVGEHEIKASKLREQVAELIKKNPDTAARLLNRWVSIEH